MQEKKVVVLGSINYDIVASAEALPAKGETVKGFSVDSFVGGKGSNQSVQLASLGVDTTLIGQVGVDSQGDFVLACLKDKNVNTSKVQRHPDFRTGCASIFIDNNGDNMLVDAFGANHAFSTAYLDMVSEIIMSADLFITQNEINLDAILYGLKIAHQASVTTILNPAPAAKLPDEAFSLVDFITPNETESEYYSNIFRADHPIEEWKVKNAQWFISRGVKNVCITMGEEGSFFANSETSFSVSAFKIDPIDTTAAGDAFNGGFAYGILNNWPYKKCLVFGNACGAMASMTLGAQNSIQPLKNILAFLDEHGIHLN